MFFNVLGAIRPSNTTLCGRSWRSGKAHIDGVVSGLHGPANRLLVTFLVIPYILQQTGRGASTEHE